MYLHGNTFVLVFHVCSSLSHPELCTAHEGQEDIATRKKILEL